MTVAALVIFLAGLGLVGFNLESALYDTTRTRTSVTCCFVGAIVAIAGMFWLSST